MKLCSCSGMQALHGGHSNWCTCNLSGLARLSFQAPSPVSARRQNFKLLRSSFGMKRCGYSATHQASCNGVQGACALRVIAVTQEMPHCMRAYYLQSMRCILRCRGRECKRSKAVLLHGALSAESHGRLSKSWLLRVISSLDLRRC